AMVVVAVDAAAVVDAIAATAAATAATASRSIPLAIEGSLWVAALKLAEKGCSLGGRSFSSDIKGLRALRFSA
ncbi:MAG: hypothetical protein WB949_11065, partial [Candidatus Acidiferrales bacterium]